MGARLIQVFIYVGGGFHDEKHVFFFFLIFISFMSFLCLVILVILFCLLVFLCLSISFFQIRTSKVFLTNKAPTNVDKGLHGRRRLGRSLEHQEIYSYYDYYYYYYHYYYYYYYYYYYH